MLKSKIYFFFVKDKWGHTYSIIRNSDGDIHTERVFVDLNTHLSQISMDTLGPYWLNFIEQYAPRCSIIKLDGRRSPRCIK